MNPQIPDGAAAQIREALFRGRKIEAIKLYRETDPVGLAEAKSAVETIEKELRALSPEKFTAPSKGMRCLSLLLMVAALVYGIIWLIRR